MPVQSRRTFLGGSLGLAGLGLLAGCSRLPMQSRVVTPRRIGFLALSPEPYHEALFQGLRDLGYVEGENVIIERRYAKGIVVQLQFLGSELAKLPLDVLVVAGVGVSGTDASRTIPIVIVQPDAVEKGFVTNLARPNGNVTGISLSTPPLATKRMEILKTAIPSMARVAVLEAGGQTNVQALALVQAARVLGVTVTRDDMYSEIIKPEFTDRFFNAIQHEQPDGLVVLDTPYLATNRARIMQFAAESHIPAMYPQRAFVDDGGLMSYGPNYSDMYRRLATYVDKVLKGTRPQDLPMEQPTRLDFVLNLKTAQTLGLTMPSSILQQTTEVIQ